MMFLFLLEIQATFFKAYRIGGLKGFQKKSFFNLDFKGVIEKCVGCFHVYLFEALSY